MNLIMHIGNHKAGSSSIQRGLEENHEALIKYGVLYPRTALIVCAHHNLSFSLKGKASGFESQPTPKSLKYYREEIINEAKNHKIHTVVISSEDFMRFNEKDILDFASFTDAFDHVKVIVYLRNHISLLESSYKFNVLWEATSETKSFKEHLDENLQSNFHEYDKRIEPWLMLRDNVDLVVKDFHSEIQGGLCVNFFKELNIDRKFKGHLIDEVVNSSLTRFGTLLLRANNREKIFHRKSLIQKISEIESEKILNRKEMLYTPVQFKQTIDRFKASNQNLNSRFGIDLTTSINMIDTALCCGEKYTDNDVLRLMEIDSDFRFDFRKLLSNHAKRK